MTTVEMAFSPENKPENARRRIALADPGDEGDRIARALEALGFPVERVTPESLSSDLDYGMVILAGEEQETLFALRKLGGELGSSVIPLILLGAPTEAPFDLADAVYLGAHAFYARPVPIERLVRKVQSFFSGEAGVRLSSMPSEAPSSPSISLPPIPRHAAIDFDDVPAPRVKTEALIDDAPPLRVPTEVFVDEPPRVKTEALVEDERGYGHAGMDDAVPGERLSSPTTYVPFEPSFDDAAEVSRVRGVSMRLEDLFLRADRRLFPRAQELVLDFSVREVPPIELVPNEIFEAAFAPVDVHSEEDAIDALTYVGPAPSPSAVTLFGGTRSPAPGKTGQTGQSRAKPSSSSSTPAPTTKTRGVPKADTPHSGVSSPASLADFTFGELAEGTDVRSGLLSRDELVELVFAIERLRGSMVLELARPKRPAEPPFGVRFIAGQVASVRAGAALQVLRELARDKGLRFVASDAAAAELELTERVQSGELDAFDVEKRKVAVAARAFEDLLGAGEPVTFELRQTSASSELAESRGFSSPSLASVLLDWARRRISTEDVRASVSGDVRLRLGEPEFVRAAFALIEPELAAFFRARDGVRLDELDGLLPPGLGVAGVVWCFARARALTLVPLTAVGERAPALTSEQAERDLRALTLLADEADYFRVLDAAPHATSRDIQLAYERRVAHLERLAVHGLDDRATARIRRVFDDARDCLLDDATRTSYARYVA